MKKFHLLCIAVIALLATACVKNVPPTLTLTYQLGDNFPEVEVGSTVTFNFNCQGKKLENLKVTFTNDGATFRSEEFSLAGAENAAKTLTFILNQTGHITMNAILQDAKGNTATASCNFESIAKPTSFFIGNYSGYTVIDGTVAATQIPYSYPIPHDQVPVSAIVTESDQDGMVNISLTYDGITYATTGTIMGLHIDFAPFDVEIEVSESLITGTIDLEGDKNGETLLVTGTIEGEGSVTLDDFPIAMPVTLSGTVSGEMNLQR